MDREILTYNLIIICYHIFDNRMFDLILEKMQN